jgi:hypothetical protein
MKETKDPFRLYINDTHVGLETSFIILQIYTRNLVSICDGIAISISNDKQVPKEEETHATPPRGSSKDRAD